MIGASTKLFDGHMMTCGFCHDRKQSDPNVESGWTAIQADDIVIFLCPDCYDGLVTLIEYDGMMTFVLFTAQVVKMRRTLGIKDRRA